MIWFFILAVTLHNLVLISGFLIIHLISGFKNNGKKILIIFLIQQIIISKKSNPYF